MIINELFLGILNSYDLKMFNVCECRWNSPNRGGVNSKPPRAYQNQDAVPEDGFLSGIVLGHLIPFEQQI